MNTLSRTLGTLLLAVLPAATMAADPQTIVTFWAGPTLNTASLDRIQAANFTTIFCDSEELPLLQGRPLQVILSDKTLRTDDLSIFDQKVQELAPLAGPQVVGFYFKDEPSQRLFGELAEKKTIVDRRAPGKLSFINLLPNYATDRQLGISPYTAYLTAFVETVKPTLLSYDHYHFNVGSDSKAYFENLAQIRDTALRYGMPFMNTVQATTWAKSVRFPKPEEVAFLVNTSLAYGAEHLAYYAYTYPGPYGGIEKSDGTPTALYPAVTRLNKRFIQARALLEGEQSIAVYHKGDLPRGTKPLPTRVDFGLSGPDTEHSPGFVVGFFGTGDQARYAYVVNLDYSRHRKATVTSVKPFSVYDFSAQTWSDSTMSADLDFEPGDGELISWKE